MGQSWSNYYCMHTAPYRCYSLLCLSAATLTSCILYIYKPKYTPKCLMPTVKRILSSWLNLVKQSSWKPFYWVTISQGTMKSKWNVIYSVNLDWNGSCNFDSNGSCIGVENSESTFYSNCNMKLIIGDFWIKFLRSCNRLPVIIQTLLTEVVLWIFLGSSIDLWLWNSSINEWPIQSEVYIC